MQEREQYARYHTLCRERSLCETASLSIHCLRHASASLLPPRMGKCNEAAAHNYAKHCVQKALRTITGDRTASLSKASYQAYDLLSYRSLLSFSNVRLVHRLLLSNSLLMKKKFKLLLACSVNTTRAVLTLSNLN